MAKYIFYMGNNTKKETEADTLEQAIEKLGLSMNKPIGTRDGKPDSVVHIDVRSEGAKWMPISRDGENSKKS